MSTGIRSADRASLSAGAWESAESAATRAGVTVRKAEGLKELKGVADLCAEVWGSQANPPVKSEMLRALVHAGNYVAGAFVDDDQMVGACVGFFGPPDTRTLHSHLTAVSTARRGRDVGFGLKLHQRAWALQSGAEDVTWTFDPLLRRNAHFNVVKLGAELEGYVPDFYGAMDDGLNRGSASDRLLVRWRLGDEKAVQACSADARTRRLRVAGDGLQPVRVVVAVDEVTGSPILDSEWGESSMRSGDLPDTVAIAIPADIESMRASRPDVADAWRWAVRRTLGSLLEYGWSVHDVDAADRYVCVRQRADA